MADISLRAVQRHDYPVQPNSDSFVNHLPDVASGDDGQWGVPGSASQAHQAQVVGASPEAAPEWHPEGALPLAVGLWLRRQTNGTNSHPRPRLTLNAKLNGLPCWSSA
jgi:hypothetical protein